MKVAEFQIASALNPRIRRALRFSPWALMVLLLGFIACAGAARAGTLFVPNASFESQPTTNVNVLLDGWEDQPQSPFYNPSDFGGNPWFALMGNFANTATNSFDFIDNMDGNQAAFIFTFPGAGFFQDLNSVDWTGVATHSFNSVYEAGRSYQLTTAFTSSDNVPLTNGASMEMDLYYRDVSNNIVIVGTTNIVFSTNVFTNLTHFIDFTVNVPTVHPTDAWAGKNIGIQFISTTFQPQLVTGVWDLDNVRLTSTIDVPNFSFESQPTTNVNVLLDNWQDQPQSPFYNSNDFGGNPWFALMGNFANTASNSFDFIDNMNGSQAAFIFTFPGAGFLQDFTTIDWTGVAPPNPFDVTLDAGKSYTLTTAFTSSDNVPLTNGASMEMALYYRDALSNIDVIAATNIVFDTNVFTNLTHFIDFSTTIPEVKATDPWAGKTVGIEFVSTTFQPQLITGVWDVDNVRLTERVATALNSPVLTNGQFSFALQSEPGLKFAIISATNVAASPGSWITNAILTNVSGNISFTDNNTNHQRFYAARQLQ